MGQNLSEIQSRLQDYYHHTFPEQKDAQILGVASLTEGWESIIYAFKVVADPKSDNQPQNLILRLYPGTDAKFKSQREFKGMQVLHRLGYPVPLVYHLERENSPFEKPFVLMEKIEGDMLWSVLGRSEPRKRAALITQFCDLFGQLHRLDWRPFVPETEHTNFTDPYIFADRFIAEVHNAAATFPNVKVFQPIIDWLKAHTGTVPCARPAPVHWDFHPGNIILRPDGAMSVIDWTQIQVSDPRFDLGWTLLLVGAYEGDEMRSAVLTEYQRIAGIGNIEQLAFFDVANAIKRLGSVMISLSAGADQMGMRPEATENMRRDFPALQWVYDLLVDRTGIRIAEVEVLFSR
jgi:aminoglycoside phosphotransferase (APT) family kinase protein